MVYDQSLQRCEYASSACQKHQILVAEPREPNALQPQPPVQEQNFFHFGGYRHQIPHQPDGETEF